MNDAELERLAAEAEGDFRRRSRGMEDFRFDEQQEQYWDVTTGNLLGPKAVDGAIPRADWPTRIDGRTGEPRPYPPSRAINDVDTGLTVEGSTWWPGREMLLENTLVSARGVRPLEGAVCYNSYLPPSAIPVPEGASPEGWITHVKKLYPDPVEHEHFFDFCAHAIQRPGEKVNHGLVLAGAQGIGKDTALLPVRLGVGEWNAAEVGPDAVTSQYNGFLRSVLLVINEVRPQDEDYKASNFYNLLKPVLAAPPEMLPMTIKYANTIYIRNLAHVILTTNDPLTMYIPPEDRRLFVMTSPLEDAARGKNRQFVENYFEDLHADLAAGGAAAVVEWLAKRPIFDFNSTAIPPMTAGKQAIIDSANQVRRTASDELFELYVERVYAGKVPKVIFHRDLTDFVKLSEFFDDAESMVKSLNAKNFHFKMAERGFDLVRNPDAHSWVNGKYRTRVAFLARTVPRADAIKVIRGELAGRPLAF